MSKKSQGDSDKHWKVPSEEKIVEIFKKHRKLPNPPATYNVKPIVTYMDKLGDPVKRRMYVAEQ